MFIINVYFPLPHLYHEQQLYHELLTSELPALSPDVANYWETILPMSEFLQTGVGTQTFRLVIAFPVVPTVTLNMLLHCILYCFQQELRICMFMEKSTLKHFDNSCDTYVTKIGLCQDTLALLFMIWYYLCYIAFSQLWGQLEPL